MLNLTFQQFDLIIRENASGVISNQTAYVERGDDHIVFRNLRFLDEVFLEGAYGLVYVAFESCDFENMVSCAENSLLTVSFVESNLKDVLKVLPECTLSILELEHSTINGLDLRGDCGITHIRNCIPYGQLYLACVAEEVSISTVSEGEAVLRIGPHAKISSALYISRCTGGIAGIHVHSSTIRLLRVESTVLQGGLRTHSSSIEFFHVQEVSLDSFDIGTGTIDRLTLEGKVKANSGLRIGGKYPNSGGPRIGEFVIKLIESSRVVTRFTSIESISFTDSVLEKGSLEFSGLTLKLLSFNMFINKGSIHFSKLRIEGGVRSVVLNDSSLGDCSFMNADFSAVGRFAIQDCAVADITTINVTWPKEFKPVDNNSNIYESFRQLKLAARRQEDTVNYLRFKSLEMEEYRKLKSVSNVWDKFTLWVGSFNSFGLNWIFPLFLILSLTFILMVLGFELSDISVKKHKSAYFQLLNPVHRLSSLGIPTKDMNGWFLFFDLLIRVVNGVLIYQVIAAFRKFSVRR